jgi:hypothetical protein
MTAYRLNLYQRSPETSVDELVRTLNFDTPDNEAAKIYMDKAYGERMTACDHAVLVREDDAIIWEKRPPID